MEIIIYITILLIQLIVVIQYMHTYIGVTNDFCIQLCLSLTISIEPVQTIYNFLLKHWYELIIICKSIYQVSIKLLTRILYSKEPFLAP